MPQVTEAYEWQGRTVRGRDGDKIGTVKDVSPKERVRLAKDTVTDEAEVSEEVRKERIEQEGQSVR